MDFFLHLEMHLRQDHPPLCGRDHLSYRSAYFPVKDVIDGDLCEQFAQVAPAPRTPARPHCASCPPSPAAGQQRMPQCAVAAALAPQYRQLSAAGRLAVPWFAKWIHINGRFLAGQMLL